MSTKDTLYVNLEPCCHHGKTPPCTDAIIAAGIRRVVYGMRDPDLRVAGKGVATLRAAGVEVIGPVSAALCERFNRGFVSARRSGRPWVTLKQAVDADGSIAHADGSPKQITSDVQNAWSHRWLRARHDAILVGVGTILADNPKLNTRIDQFFSYKNNTLVDQKNSTSTKVDQKQPLRVILDPALRCPLEAVVLTDDRPDRTMLLVDAAKICDDDDRIARLRERGVVVRHVQCTPDGIAWGELWDALLTHGDGAQGCTSVLVEGGARTWQAFRRSRCVDEEIFLAGYADRDAAMEW